MPRSVSLAPAKRSDQKLIANLLQLYLHDLSEYSEEPVSQAGFFEYPYLDLYWVEPGRFPFLIHSEDTIAGFALVREISPQVYELAEFFVLRSLRGQKVGEQAARDLFSRFPGTWHVAQEAANTPAQAFWRAVIGAFTSGQYTEEVSEQPVGPRQVFISKGSSSP